MNVSPALFGVGTLQRECTVLLAPPPGRVVKFQRILVGWDGSEPANAALRMATALGGEVEALAVFSSTNETLSPERHDVREQFTTVLDGRQVRFHAILEATSPARALAGFARDHGFDLIAVGQPSVSRDGDATVSNLATEAHLPLLIVGTDGGGELVSVSNDDVVATEYPYQRSVPRDSTESSRRVARDADGLGDDGGPVNLRCSAVLFRNSSVLLCQRLLGEDLWVLPGGTPEPGEGSAHCAAREVAEETGLDIMIDRVAFVLEASSMEAGQHEIEIVFLGSERTQRHEPEQKEPHLRPRFVPLDTITQLRMAPPIGGYLRGLAARLPEVYGDMALATAPYLGNVWRPESTP